MLCEECRDARAFYCEGADRYFHDRTRWRKWQCMMTLYGQGLLSVLMGLNARERANNYPNSMCVVLATGAKWCSQYFEDHGFRCDYTGDCYPNADRVTLADGHVVCKDVLHRLGFTCPSCSLNYLNSQRRGEKCITCVQVEAADAVGVDMAFEELGRPIEEQDNV